MSNQSTGALSVIVRHRNAHDSRYELGAIPNAELAIQAERTRLDRAQGHAERCGDGRVRLSLYDPYGQASRGGLEVEPLFRLRDVHASSLLTAQRERREHLAK